MAERRNPKLVGRWFIVTEEGGPWVFVDKDVWDRTGAQIRGERFPDGSMTIEDGYINKVRKDHVSDRTLMEFGYVFPVWACVACPNTAALKPKFCPECGTPTGTA